METMFSNYPDVMTVEELAAALGCGRTWAYKLINSGQIKSFSIGRSIRIPKLYVLDFIEAASKVDE